MSTSQTQRQTRDLSRRQFGRIATLGATGAMTAMNTAGTPQYGARNNQQSQRIPLKIGHRAASMKMVGDFDVLRVAKQIRGLDGVELQVAHGERNLRDFDTIRHYKREAHRWGVMIPSLAGVWDRGVSIMRSPAAGINLLQSIRAAELLGVSVILVAFFRDNAPDMNDEASYGPVVELLQKSARYAADAGVTLGLENSLSPADNAKLIDVVSHPNVRVYYDVYNVAHYGHGKEAVSGIKLLGKDKICQVHVKNREKLIEEPGPIDWRAAFATFNEIGYDGWYVFESQHSNRKQLIDATTKNIEFLMKVCQMPLAQA